MLAHRNPQYGLCGVGTEQAHKIRHLAPGSRVSDLEVCDDLLHRSSAEGVYIVHVRAIYQNRVGGEPDAAVQTLERETGLDPRIAPKAPGEPGHGRRRPRRIQPQVALRLAQ